MNTIRKFVLITLFPSLFLACQDEQLPVSSEFEQIPESEFYLESTDNLPEISGCSIEEDMEIEPIYLFVNDPYGFMNISEENNNDLKENKHTLFGRRDQRIPPKHIPVPFFRILRSLELEDNQISLLREAMVEFRGCVREVRRGAYLNIQQIIEKTREKRRGIILQLREGAIERSEAIQLLRRLNNKTRSQIEDSGIRELMCIKIHDCQKALFDSIESFLNDDQLSKWLEWIEKLPEDPCNKN